MTSRDFCYWLQGYFEISPPDASLSAEQAEMVRRHLELVFKHEIDPSQGPPEHQAELNAIHLPPAKQSRPPAYRPPQEPIEHLKARC